MIRIMPIMARSGEKDSGFSSRIRILSPCRPVRLSSHAVIVVPMLAPMIMPVACVSFMIPELTKPTTITVVAEDDWITAVTPAPSRTPLIGLFVIFSSVFSSFPPESFSSPLPSRFMPNRKKASPPTRDRQEKISITLFLSFLNLLFLYITILP